MANHAIIEVLVSGRMVVSFIVGRRLVDRRLVDKRLIDRRLVDRRLVDRRPVGGRLLDRKKAGGRETVDGKLMDDYVLTVILLGPYDGQVFTGLNTNKYIVVD